MSTIVEQLGEIVLLDGLPIAQTHNPHAFLLKHQGQSTDYALKHGGYSIESREHAVRGWMAYLLIAGRRGYGIDGLIVRTAENLQRIAHDSQANVTEDYLFAEHAIRPMLDGFLMLLNYTSGHLAIVNGELDAWARATAARFHFNLDD